MAIDTRADTGVQRVGCHGWPDHALQTLMQLAVRAIPRATAATVSLTAGPGRAETLDAADPAGDPAAGSSLRVPLPRGPFPPATLTVFADDRQPWPQHAVATAELIAAEAASILTEWTKLQQARGTIGQLSQALETRTTIGQAQGILMARQQIDAPAAFDVLRRASQRTNRKLRDIACEVVARASAHPPAATAPDGRAGPA